MGDRQKKDTAQKAKVPGKKEEGTNSDITIGRPFHPGSTFDVVFPVSRSTKYDRKRKVSFYGSSKSSHGGHKAYYSSSRGWSGDFLNLIFWNRDSAGYHLLKPEPLHILSFRFFNAEWMKDGGFYLFQMIQEDRDGDGSYENEDGVTLFHSRPDGKGLEPLTPSGHHLVSVYPMLDEKELILRTRTDANEDSEFDHTDPLHVLKVDLRTMGTAEPIFDKKFLRSIDKLQDQE